VISAASIWQKKVFAKGNPRLDRPKIGRPQMGEPLWFEWLMLLGMLAFGAWLLGTRGVWALLIVSDPTGITAIIIVLFVGATLWCGARALELSKQLEGLNNASIQSKANTQATNGDGWAADYWRNLHLAPAGSDAPMDILVSKTHGPHSSAWWVNAIQLKLGLLGKVIGFSILALNIGQLQSFDPAQSQELLKSLTSGLGVALLTTMVGLVGNILLGLQITRLDRYADDIVEKAQQIGLELNSERGAT
jgi:MotA/TolQ/ExbB proton channel family